ncbi:MAG: type pilus assembly protein PilM [Betaproteobacteria bacterium]|jgi:type IV pilus assembly protein PilM|nr:type pilus assembly protein PilM [Betaproteobacteria bacterium]
MLKGKFSFDPGVLKFDTSSLERLFKPKAPPLIGADLSSSSIKMVELTEVGRGLYRVERYAIEPLPRDSVVEGNINNLDAVSDALKRCHKRLGTNIKNLALALPNAAVISKRIYVPAGQTEEELEVQVETEANQYIPFSLDEVNLDFQVLGPAPNNAEDVEVLIAASRKEKIEDRVAAAEAAGLKATVMDVDLYAAQAAFELMMGDTGEEGKDENIAMVDVGATTMAVNVLRNGQSIYLREQPFGGNELSQEIQNKFGLSADEAEVAKRDGGLPPEYETEILQPFVDKMGLEIARALHFFFSSTPYNQVAQIVLAGGCAAIPGADEAISRRTQVPTVVANPFVNMDVSPKVKVKSLTQDAPSLMVACGLALRRFDP